ncbi:MAG: hypothetical protein ACLU4P_05835 [Ruminococcus sp.]
MAIATFTPVQWRKSAQLEAAYRRQQQEISELKDFVARNKARVSTRNMAMSRQKKLDKMDDRTGVESRAGFRFKQGRTPANKHSRTDLQIGYNEPLPALSPFLHGKRLKIALVGANGMEKQLFRKSIRSDLHH